MNDSIYLLNTFIEFEMTFVSSTSSVFCSRIAKNLTDSNCALCVHLKLAVCYTVRCSIWCLCTAAHCHRVGKTIAVSLSKCVCHIQRRNWKRVRKKTRPKSKLE